MKKTILIVLSATFLIHCTKHIAKPAPPRDKIPEFFIPSGTNEQIIEHKFYTLSCSEKHEQAEWVAYQLTNDYKKYGYFRGHFCPAGDINVSEQTRSESFFMSNISPQDSSFNNGIWSSLEAHVRDWAREHEHLHIVTGPIWQDKKYQTISRDSVAIPEYYYKAILDIMEPGYKTIAFILPNACVQNDLFDFAVTIDSLECRTGIDFFHELPDWLETELEKRRDIEKWQ
ncbi:DNA/RNA non-specific endonuclease [candidate division KSB1 bacterium]|nr:DNA/RNA non-specific endonuclease [candidate division KSB1 bacterium]RQW02501.1 MAG: DNA/RNA non-specific endonuclease [candidate division KSB1 bacterium]